MSVLEKILEEIDERISIVKNIPVNEDDDFLDGEECYENGRVQGRLEELVWCRDIIRSHMDEADKKEFEFDFNRVESFDCQCGRRYVNTYNDGWIQVEDGLPEEDDSKRYIITDERGFLHSEMEYGNPVNNGSKACFYKWDDECWDCYKPKVIAWMPLPEPYKPKEKNNE